jgi:hypothetical protein
MPRRKDASTGASGKWRRAPGLTHADPLDRLGVNSRSMASRVPVHGRVMRRVTLVAPDLGPIDHAGEWSRRLAPIRGGGWPRWGLPNAPLRYGRVEAEIPSHELRIDSALRLRERDPAAHRPRDRRDGSSTQLDPRAAPRLHPSDDERTAQLVTSARRASCRKLRGRLACGVRRRAPQHPCGVHGRRRRPEHRYTRSGESATTRHRDPGVLRPPSLRRARHGPSSAASGFGSIQP